MYVMGGLTRPGIFQLIAFGLVATTVLLLLIYRVSFSWWFYKENFFIFIILPVIIFLILSLWIDRQFKTKIKRYSILTMVLLLVSLLVFIPIKKWLLEDTEARGEILIKAIEDYKIQFGHYPQHINGPYFKDVPNTALINRRFRYRVYQVDSNRLTYVIYCASFNGQFAYRYEGRHDWAYAD